MDSASSHWIATGYALLAAFTTAVGIVVRQRAIQRHSSSEPIVTSWVRDPTWWTGTGVAVAGYVFQALALAYGSLLLVQPLLVSALLFVLPLGARLSHQQIRRSDWGWALLLTAALTVFVLVGRPSEGGDHQPASALDWVVVFAVAVPLVIGCALASRRTCGRRRALLLAIAVAVMFGLTAVLTKVCTHRFSVTGWHGLLTLPAPYVVVALAVAVTILQQSAFNAGALQASVPVMLVGEPLVATVVGLVVLGEGLRVQGWAGPLLAAAIVAMTAATIALARGSGAHSDRLSAGASPTPATRSANRQRVH